jgi:hypothetical protein
MVGEEGYTLAELFLGRNNARLAVVILQAAVLVESGCAGLHDVRLLIGPGKSGTKTLS